MKLHLVTLKLSKELSSRRSVFDLFNDRASCDVFIRSLIVCIDQYKLQLYGFVILSDQVHLILQSETNLQNEIRALKSLSANMIIDYLREKLSSFDGEKADVMHHLQSFIEQFLQREQTTIWQNSEMSDELTYDPMLQLDMISAEKLREYLEDSSRNYLQLGANAFTRLMMDRMKI